MVKSILTLHTIHGLCQMIEAGKLVIPTFQRGFVWSRARVVNMLESIYRGYPIGTIVVLEDQAGRFGSLPPGESKFPGPESAGESVNTSWYVIDGSQRLAALYNCFFATNDATSFWFDLESEHFLPATKSSGIEPSLNLRWLYSSERYLSFQKSLFTRGSEENLFDKVQKLYEAFRDYQVPVQILRDVSFDDVIEIYQAINTSGKPLTKAELEKSRAKSS